MHADVHRVPVRPARRRDRRGVGPIIGVVIGMLAIVSITYSIRRFWRANHSKRWHYTIFGLTIIGFLIFLAFKDIATIT